MCLLAQVNKQANLYAVGSSCLYRLAFSVNLSLSEGLHCVVLYIVLLQYTAQQLPTRVN